MAEGGIPLVSPFLMDFPLEERENYPEAVAMLETLAIHLKKTDFCDAKKLEDYEKLHQNTNDLIKKRRRTEIFLKALKLVLKEQERNGFKILSETVVKELEFETREAEVKMAGFGELVETAFGLRPCPPKDPLVTLSEKDHLTVLELVKERIALMAAKLKPRLESQLQLEHLRKETVKMQLDVRNQMLYVERLQDKAYSLLKEIKQSEQEMNEPLEISKEIIKLKFENDMLKLKMAEVNVLRNMYGGEKCEKIKNNLEEIEVELQNVIANNTTLREKLNAYNQLPKQEFASILEEYKKVYKDVESAKFCLQKLVEN